MTNDLDELVPQFLTIATGNISDALFELGIEPCSVPGPTALVPGQPRFAGPAFTVQQRAKGNPAGPGRTRQLEVIDAIAAPGDVIVIDVGGRTDVCTLGGLLASALRPAAWPVSWSTAVSGMRRTSQRVNSLSIAWAPHRGKARSNSKRPALVSRCRSAAAASRRAT